VPVTLPAIPATTGVVRDESGCGMPFLARGCDGVAGVAGVRGVAATPPELGTISRVRYSGLSSDSGTGTISVALCSGESWAVPRKEHFSVRENFR